MHEPHYLSYLLRLWMVKSAGETLWRASLESSLTGDRLGFPDLEALFLYLERITQDRAYEKIALEERDQE